MRLECAVGYTNRLLQGVDTHPYPSKEGMKNLINPLLAGGAAGMCAKAGVDYSPSDIHQA